MTRRAATSPPRAAATGRSVRRPSGQFDLFPVEPLVEALDPRGIVGAGTGVAALVRVRFRPDDAPHLVFHDRHGWYCDTHGPTCEAVALAQRSPAVEQAAG